jgi:hypothetical protein
MATVLDSDVTGSAEECAITQDLSAAEFADVLMADDQWVCEEFEALIAAGWGDDVPPGPEPLQGSRWPRRPGYDHRSTPAPRPEEPRPDEVHRPISAAPRRGNKDFARSPTQADRRCGPTRTGPQLLFRDRTYLPPSFRDVGGVPGLFSGTPDCTASAGVAATGAHRAGGREHRPSGAHRGVSAGHPWSWTETGRPGHVVCRRRRMFGLHHLRQPGLG